MVKVIGYARVSTEGQAVDGVSLDAQRAQIAAWAGAHGGELAGMFVDAGVSGKRADNRAELQKALTLACRTRGVLVVYSLSRLARSTRDAIAIAERLGKARANLVSLTEAIDTTTATGKMVFTLFAAFAQFERDLTSERTSAALQFKRARGERAGNVPFGYKASADGVALEPEPAERAVVERIADLRRSGLTLRAIAASLNRAGIPTRRGSEWRHQYVAAILRSAPEPVGAARKAAA